MNSSGDVSLELSLSSMKDPDISLLITQNQALASELAQCQADKDFVWSLWKKLQVSNPDVTEAISLVTQREKEKSENKDRKVLEIIQVKDDRIEELQDIVTKQAEEISDALSKKVELTEKNSRLQIENDRLQSQVRTLEIQCPEKMNFCPMYQCPEKMNFCPMYQCPEKMSFCPVYQCPEKMSYCPVYRCPEKMSFCPVYQCPEKMSFCPVYQCPEKGLVGPGLKRSDMF
ncbi:centlein-like [Plakobranchus ocellatus]|uniref:Centlein-like n=1 Tax=Plakobranchus ocellatus TaxID=259542 RepID=A0AAV4CXA1_9GAST|nr:centlein-like [Plakobranchus ocellatus]